jgi:hypothetical protein
MTRQISLRIKPTPPRARLIEGDDVVVYTAAWCCEIDTHGRHCHAVLDLQAANPHRAEQFFVHFPVPRKRNRFFAGHEDAPQTFVSSLEERSVCALIQVTESKKVRYG